MTLDDVCKAFNIEDIDDFSDGFHTFGQLYYQRAVLFAVIINQNKDRYECWKTWKHEDGELCFGGDWFLVCIETPEGMFSYHYPAKHWDLFKCKEIFKAKSYDGHSWRDVTRLLSL